MYFIIQHNVFNHGFNTPIIPIPLKVLVALRVLARGECHDTASEISGVGESTCHSIFRMFVSKFSRIFRGKMIVIPTGDDLKKSIALFHLFFFMQFFQSIQSLAFLVLWARLIRPIYTGTCAQSR